MDYTHKTAKAVNKSAYFLHMTATTETSPKEDKDEPLDLTL